ncbi:hypothetical protein [Aliiruegeria sabulilitoris]|uniref:hypothetical protein n=1 Tax=Aliiruegeria sabulilitoris TaxID=1510458 RepID=UPI000835BFF6|nr:hypothetical protein [Aliiruegeria sabulilitoris]NDR58284.1 hypothetical protein [Pseudoruegeria sp. M32A2M]
MLSAHWFMRMKRWVQHPPSLKRVLLVFAVIALCLALVGLERLGVLPDWMQADQIGRRPGLPRF